jgi:hypothetical protein
LATVRLESKAEGRLVQNISYSVIEINKKLKIVLRNKINQCFLPDTTILDQTLSLSVQKLEFIAWSDWLVGSHMAF